MIPLPLLDSDAPMLRVESLHALAYCQRLFYLQEVERLSTPDERVFAGRQLHAALEPDEEGEVASLDLSSPALGLYGKVDCIRRRDGAIIPYEHKRGQPRRGNDNSVSPWPSDRPAPL